MPPLPLEKAERRCCWSNMEERQPTGGGWPDIRNVIRLCGFLREQWLIWLLVVFFTVAQSTARLYLPALMADIVNLVVREQDMSAFWRYGVQMFGICVLTGASGYFAFVLSAVGSQKFALNIRAALYRKVSALSVSAVDEIGKGTLITRLTADVNVCTSMADSLTHMLIEPVVMLIGGSVLLLSIETQLGTAFGALVFCQALFLAAFIRKTTPCVLRLKRLTDLLNRRLQQTLARTRLIKTLNVRDTEQKRFCELNQDLLACGVSVRKITSLFHPAIMLIADFSVAVVLIVAARTTGAEKMPVGSIMESIIYMQEILLSVVISGQMFQVIADTIPSVRRITETLYERGSFPDGTRAVDKAVSSIELWDVSFCYPASGTVLKNLSLSVGKGEFLSVTGPVGCGKSTLAGLLARLFDPQTGTVFLNRTDIRRYRLVDVRKHIALVEKRSSLVSGTVMDNLVFGRDFISPEDVDRAVRAAQCADYLDALPEKYQTPILSIENTFSGGERQRLTIARALAGKPDVLLLDDCTSSLDYATEEALLREIRRAYPELSIVLFTQRARSASMADKVAYMSGGNITHIGEEREMRVHCKPYRTMFFSRQREETADAGT